MVTPLGGGGGGGFFGGGGASGGRLSNLERRVRGLAGWKAEVAGRHEADSPGVMAFRHSARCFICAFLLTPGG